jgi:hypothetical protein
MQHLLPVCLSHSSGRRGPTIRTQEREARGPRTLLRRGVDAARRPLLQRVRHHLRATPQPFLSAAGAVPAPLSVAPVRKAALACLLCAGPVLGVAVSRPNLRASQRERPPGPTPPGDRITSHALRIAPTAARSRALPHTHAITLTLTRHIDALARRAARRGRAWPGRRAEMRAPRLRSPSAATSRISRASRPRSQMSSSWLKLVRALRRAPRTPLAARAAAVQAAAVVCGGCRRWARCRRWRPQRPSSERTAFSVDGHGLCSGAPSAPSPGAA